MSNHTPRAVWARSLECWRDLALYTGRIHTIAILHVSASDLGLHGAAVAAVLGAGGAARLNQLHTLVHIHRACTVHGTPQLQVQGPAALQSQLHAATAKPSERAASGRSAKQQSHTLHRARLAT